MHVSCVYLAPVTILSASVTPENYIVSYNSTFWAEIILQGFPSYNRDFQIMDWRTGNFSSIEHTFENTNGYLILTVQYSSFNCSNTGIHRAVLELEDHSQLQYELQHPLLISGKNSASKFPLISNALLVLAIDVKQCWLMFERFQTVTDS